MTVGFDIEQAQDEDMIVNCGISAPGFNYQGKFPHTINQRIVMKAGQTDSRAVVQLQANVLGQHTIAIDFFRDNGYLLTKELPITIIP